MIVADFSYAGGKSTLRPGQAIEFEVLVAGEVEIGPVTVRVSENGSASFPLVGNINIAGYSLEQLRGRLASEYSANLRNPQVTADFVMDDGENAVSPYGYVTVMGRVKNPGWINIPATRDLTVSRAIQLAGGFDTSANLTAVRVTRKSKDGRDEEKMNINLHMLGAEGQVEHDLHLQPGDVVFVPERLF